MPNGLRTEGSIQTYVAGHNTSLGKCGSFGGKKINEIQNSRQTFPQSTSSNTSDTKIENRKSETTQEAPRTPSEAKLATSKKGHKKDVMSYLFASLGKQLQILGTKKSMLFTELSQIRDRKSDEAYKLIATLEHINALEAQIHAIFRESIFQIHLINIIRIV